MNGESDDLNHKLAGSIVRVEIHIQDAKGDKSALTAEEVINRARHPSWRFEIPR